MPGEKSFPPPPNRFLLAKSHLLPGTGDQEAFAPKPRRGLLEQKPNAPACLVKHSEEENTFESSAAPLSLPQAAKTSPLIPLKSGSGAAPHVNQVSPVLLYQPSFPFVQGALPRF